MIDVRIGHQHRFNGRTAWRARGWMQFRKTFELRPDVRRRIKQEPTPPIGADRHRRLRPGNHPSGTIPRELAYGAIAIPLRHSPARGRPKQPYAHRATLFCLSLFWKLSSVSAWNKRDLTLRRLARDGPRGCSLLAPCWWQRFPPPPPPGPTSSVSATKKAGTSRSSTARTTRS